MLVTASDVKSYQDLKGKVLAVDAYKGSPAKLEKSGVTEDTVRLCVGIEHIDDIMSDLSQALNMV
ncbi:MAG: hypothetical protein EBT78_17950 [Betaproteobacteria bacterium]|jgi:O-acetylhomoserine/O-acetylserine sulfhydrylase-like pyridoxal-dependent enzyme|nr:hypothetical protein [Betaproteobacteria bacterium]NBT69635.1 hypothetical protein [Betaproteobacteria bacterium]